MHDFPASQAALSVIRMDEPPVAERFELYYQGIELANGFQELNNKSEQRQRFVSDNQLRHEAGKPVHALDEAFLESVGQLPVCAGVAVGIDRMVALAQGEPSISRLY